MSDFQDIRSQLETDDVSTDLMQAIAILRAIDEGEMFGAIPADASARRRHEAGVTLLGMVNPRLEKVLRKLQQLA